MHAPSAFNEIFNPLTAQIPTVEDERETARADEAVAPLASKVAESILVPGLANVIVWDCEVTV